MQISFSTSAFALFALVASVSVFHLFGLWIRKLTDLYYSRGNLHAACTCVNGDSDNSRLTAAACTAYNAAGYEVRSFMSSVFSVASLTSKSRIVGWRFPRRPFGSGKICRDSSTLSTANTYLVHGEPGRKYSRRPMGECLQTDGCLGLPVPRRRWNLSCEPS